MVRSGSKVRLRRIYDDVEADGGSRVLVDRVWPRGISKDRAQLDEWCKAVAPSTQLRTWYGHDPERFDEFSRRYRAELDDGEPAEALAHLKTLAHEGTITILTATKEIEISQAAVLADLLSHSARRQAPSR